MSKVKMRRGQSYQLSRRNPVSLLIPHFMTTHQPLIRNVQDGQPISIEPGLVICSASSYRLFRLSMSKVVKFDTRQNDIFEKTKEEAGSSQLTGEQQFQLQMAELRYKTQREENIARQQEQTQRVLLALLDAVKH